MSGQDTIQPLNDRQVRVANYFEQVFWTRGQIPTIEAAALILGETESYIKGQLEKNNNFKAYLVTRGVNINNENDDLLTTEQLMLANMLLNTHDRRTEREKIKQLKDAGYDVSPQKYHAWMRQDAFRNYLRTRAEDMFKGSDWKIRQSLVDTAEDGDVSAMKLFFEMTGIHTPRLEVGFNIQSVLAQVIEVIAKYTSPEIQKLIAEDIERVLDGEPVDMRKQLPAIEARSGIAV